MDSWNFRFRVISGERELRHCASSVIQGRIRNTKVDDRRRSIYFSEGEKQHAIFIIHHLGGATVPHSLQVLIFSWMTGFSRSGGSGKTVRR